MNKPLVTILFFFSLVVHSGFMVAQGFQNKRIQNYFKQIGVAEGLSDANVNAIAKDKWGLIWIGTEYGLNRYDGHTIRKFNIDSVSSKGISSNLVYDIVTDTKGDVWIATLNGLNKFNHLTETFTVYKDPESSNIYTDILFDSLAQKIWITANKGGLKYVDLTTNRLVNCGYKNTYPLRVQLMGDSLLLGTKAQGVFVLDKNNLKVLDTIPLLKPSPVLSLAVTPTAVWVGTSKAGLLEANRADLNKITYYTQDNSNFNALGALSLTPDHSGNILIGTDGQGMFVYNQNNFYQIRKNANANSLRATAVRTIYIDKQNNIWLGTYANGVSFQPHANRNIKNYQSDVTNPNSLSTDFVLAIEESSDSSLYIGTNRGGLNQLKQGRFEHIPIPGNVVLSLCEDSAGRLWIGTYQNGIYYRQNNKLYALRNVLNDTTFDASSVWAIKEDNLGNIWFGLTHFLVKLSKNNFSYTLYENKVENPNSIINGTIRSLYLDTSNNLWVGTIKGMAKINPSSNTFINKPNLQPIADKLISTITGNDSLIFAGSNGYGIFVLSKTGELFTTLTKERTGLIHNMILGLVIDTNGFLWATTPNGISKINVANFHVENYNASDGFIGNTFNPRAVGKLTGGYLAFGSTKGLSVFHPDSLMGKVKAPPTLLTGLQVLNKQIDIDSTILSSSISFTNQFTLPPKLNSFSINYVGINYENPLKVEYKYKLEGFEDEWRIAGHRTTASYTNLEPGNYTFKVIASTGNNYWTPQPAKVNITILPYWWQTIYAKIGGVILLVVLILSIIRMRTKSLSKQKQVLANLVNERTKKLEKAYNQLAELNNQLEIKVSERTQKLEKSNSELDRFVYSASHDLSAPLKSMKGLLNLAKVDLDNNTLLYLEKLSTSIEKLEDVIQNLIQFSRNARQEVRKEPINLEKIINELQEELIYVDAENESEAISCNIQVDDDFELQSDPVRVKIILSNLLSNAIKYRHENKACQILIKGYNKAGRPTITVTDNGIGIEPVYQAKIFDMFYRATTKSMGSGLGLYIVKESSEKINARVYVASTPEKGSTFTVEFNN